ncbi:MAG: hypothetical protein HFI48_14280 [Lachnospiraceae bacterium]|nr:hypothetical protein [Lachnospiraceae bacterium]
MEGNRLNYEKDNKVSEFILPPMSEWDNPGESSENKAVASISRIKQKYRDSVLLEIYESDRILHAELANRISVSASGLNAVIKKMNDGAVKTIREIKAGKFKFYTLTKESVEYIEMMILPLLIVSGQDAEEVHNLLHLLALYKDKNPEIWINRLAELSEEEYVELENDEDTGSALGCELLKAFSQFYRRETDKALKLLELGIPNKEVQQKLILCFQEKYDKGNTSPWVILNEWEQQDCLGVYSMLDDLFISIADEQYIMKKSSYQFQNVGAGFEIVMDKIKADVLHAMFCQWPKSKLIGLWLEEKLDVHLAVYIAEKFRTLSEHFFEKIRNQEKNSDVE